MGILQGKAVAITGSGSGIGASYARHCAQLGARVVVNDIDKEAAEKIVSEIRAAGGEAVSCPGDISDWTFGGDLVAACVDAFGRIDGLVNNAAVLRHGTITDMTERDLRSMLDVNTIGTVACAFHAVRAMLDAGEGGSIVNVSSGSQAGEIALGGYGASKAAVASLTFSWAMELKDTNVRVNAVSPLAETAMSASNKGFMEKQSASREVVYTTLPPPQTNAPVVAFLLSDASIGINGQIVRIAGNELSFVTHPAIAEPVLRGEWTDTAVADAFRDKLAGAQQKMGLTYARRH
ncbi:MAG: SDR family oxidoreductase [Rhizobiaceae bacterium]|nr:SDR family oxidoreductase [Rhizobiaceae bacterium]